MLTLIVSLVSDVNLTTREQVRHLLLDHISHHLDSDVTSSVAFADSLNRVKDFVFYAELFDETASVGRCSDTAMSSDSASAEPLSLFAHGQYSEYYVHNAVFDKLERYPKLRLVHEQLFDRVPIGLGEKHFTERDHDSTFVYDARLCRERVRLYARSNESSDPTLHLLLDYKHWIGQSPRTLNNRAFDAFRQPDTVNVYKRVFEPRVDDHDHGVDTTAINKANGSTTHGKVNGQNVENERRARARARIRHRRLRGLKGASKYKMRERVQSCQGDRAATLALGNSGGDKVKEDTDGSTVLFEGGYCGRPPWSVEQRIKHGLKDPSFMRLILARLFAAQPYPTPFATHLFHTRVNRLTSAKTAMYFARYGIALPPHSSGVANFFFAVHHPLSMAQNMSFFPRALVPLATSLDPSLIPMIQPSKCNRPMQIRKKRQVDDELWIMAVHGATFGPNALPFHINPVTNPVTSSSNGIGVPPVAPTLSAQDVMAFFTCGWSVQGTSENRSTIFWNFGDSPRHRLVRFLRRDNDETERLIRSNVSRYNGESMYIYRLSDYGRSFVPFCHFQLHDPAPDTSWENLDYARLTSQNGSFESRLSSKTRSFSTYDCRGSLTHRLSLSEDILRRTEKNGTLDQDKGMFLCHFLLAPFYCAVGAMGRWYVYLLALL